MDFDYAAALQAGYTDDQILAGLDKQGLIEFDLPAARKAGYSAGDILQSLYGKRQAAPAAAEPESSGLLRRAGDLGISAVKGIIGVPEALVGLADIPTGGAAGRAAESLGVKFKESKDILSDYYSPEQKAANQRVAEAEGFTGTAGAMLANPSTIAQTAVESLPAMGLGGAVGRGVLAVAPKLGALGAAAIGEGAVGAGTAAEQIRQQSGGDLSIGQAGAALASGIGTGAFGLVGGRLAQKFGIADIDTALVQVGAPVASSKGVARRLLEGGISEGVFEELPQSMQEQIWQNAAMDKPLLDGVPEAAAQGLIVGGLFGGVAGGALNGKAPAPAVDPVTGEAAPLQLGYKPDPFISFPDGSVGRQSDVDAFINGLPEADRLAARSRLYGYAPEDAAPTVTADDVLATVDNPNVGIDDAINLAQQALASDTPDMAAARDAQIDAAWKAYIGERATQRQAELDAAEQQRRDADVSAMESQLADQQVEQAEILTRAQGFDEPAPTAMQVAMQEAQSKRQAAISAAAAPAPAAAAVEAPAAVPDDAAAVAEMSSAAQPPAAPGAAGDNLARAKQILTAAGVTGNERMTALRAIRTGENTLDDLIDAHPPKEIDNATPPTAAREVPGRSPAVAAAPAPIQQAAEAGSTPVQEPADVGAGDSAEAGIPAASDVRDGVTAGNDVRGGMTGRAAQRQATIDDLAGRSTKELRALAKSDKRAYVRTAASDVVAQRDSETRAKRSDVAKRALAKAKQIDPDRDTMAEAIARMGGIQRTSAQGRMRFAPEEVRARAGIRPLFPVNGGMRLEDMAAALAELGYVQRDENGKYDQSDFEEKLAEVAGGADVRTPQGMMLRAQQEYEAAQQQAFADSPAEYEQIEYYADNADDELQRTVDAAFDAVPTNKEYTDEEIDAAFGIAPAASRAIPEVDSAAPARESNPRDQAPASNDFDLTAESADEARARVTADEQRQQQAARDERAADDRERHDRDRRDIAARQDASADNFQLGQSADDSLSGQDALFSQSDETPSVASDALKAAVLTQWGKIAEPIDGYAYLAGKNKKNDRGIFVINGRLDRAAFKKVMSEAAAAGLETKKFYVVAETAPYMASSIDFTKFSDFAPGSLPLDDGARASTSPAASRGMPAAEVTKAIAPLRAKWAGFTRVNVVQSADGLPADIRERVTVDEGSEGFYDPRTHAVYLIADNIADASRAAWVAAHEVIGHGGLRMLNDKTVTQAVQQAGANRFVRDLAAAIQKDRGGDVAQYVALEEAIAEISAATETGDFDGLTERYRVTVPEASRNGLRGVVARVIAAVRQFLATVAGNPASEFSDADVRDMIALQRAAVEGKFGTAPAPSAEPARASIPANQRTIEVDGQRRPINYSDGTPIAADFAGQMEFWQNFDGETDSRGRPIRDEETEADAPRASRAAPPAAGEERIPSWAANLTPEQQAALRKSGAIYTEKTAKQKIKELTDGALKKMQYGILDQFAPIKDQLGKMPYIHARMAKAADGTLEAMMLYGRPHLDADGGMLVDTTKKGFIETMQQLGGEHDRFFSWLAGKRAAQLKKEGRENLFSDTDLSALATLNSGTMKDGSSREAAYLRAQKDVAELNKSVLDIAEKSGLIDAESRKVWQSDYYVPFFRVMEEGITGPSIKSGLVNQKTVKKLKGGTNNLGDLTQNMLMNWSTLLTASAKNRAAKASLDVAVGMGVASEAPESTLKAMAKSAQTRAVSYMEEGQNRFFIVEDEHLLAAISALEFNGYNNNAMRAMSWFKNTLTKAITVSPYFKVRNLIRDSLSVLAVSDINRNPLINLKTGYSLMKDNNARAQMVAGGGIYRFGMTMEGNRAENIKRLVEDGIPEHTILNTSEKMAKFVRKLWGAYEEVGDLSENLNRAALYQKLRKEGKTHLEASFEARDLMDFGLSGAWAGVRALNQILPFFNARLQGAYKLGRGYNDDPKRMGYVIGALALATIALSAIYKDDDDWKKRSDSDRANYWWFKVGGTAFRIPKPFEVGAAATAIDSFAALFYDSENTNAERFTHQMGELINGQLAMNPIPQVFRPLIDVYSNKDAFSGRPIESLAMQRLRPEDRYSSNTSELARLLGKSGVLVDPVSLVAGTGVKQLSPVQIDSLIKGYFAGVGVLAVSAADGLLHHTVIDRGAALPIPLRTMTGSFVEELPTNSSRYVDMLYKTAQDVEQTYASYQNAIKQGDIEKARGIMEEEGGTLAKYHMIESLKKNESRINQVIQRVRDDKLMTGEQKAEQIRRLKVVQDQIARQMVTGK